MVNRYLIEQVFGYFGLVFWSLQLAPQAYKTYRRGTSTGVSVWTMLIWTFAGTFMGVYNIGLNVALALWIQPQIFAFIACICLFQEFRYKHNWPRLKTIIRFILACIFFGGTEVGLVFAFKKAEQVNNQGGIHFFGIIPVVFILGGFLPQYYEIFRDKRVIGISHLFLFMDFSGSIFSSVSLAFRDKIEVLDLANYIAIACFDLGILLLYYIFEWYQKRRECNNDIEKSDNTAQVATAREASYDCKDVRDTNFLSSEATTKTTS